jgi:hypothetical protein
MRDVPTVTPRDHRAHFDLPRPASCAVVNPAVALGPIGKTVRLLAQAHPRATAREAKSGEGHAREILTAALGLKARVKLVDVFVVGREDAIPKRIGVADALDQTEGLARQIEVMRDRWVVAHNRLCEKAFHARGEVTWAWPWRRCGEAREVLRGDLHRCA